VKSDTENQHEIIIEPFEEYDEEEDEEDEIEMMNSKSHQHSTPKPSPQHQLPPLLSSNELFLQSLKSSLDKLSEEKNMRARIAIQESLYKIMYEK
jgi:BESS motif